MIVDLAGRRSSINESFALGLFIFAGPGLRTSLLGSLLVAEAEIGRIFGLSDEGLAVLLESLVCGALIAMMLLPMLTAKVGTHRLSLMAALGVLGMLVATFATGRVMMPSWPTTVALFGGATALGFTSAMLAAVTQSMLSRISAPGSSSRELLQSVWTAGQPAGFIVGSIGGGVLVASFGWWAAFALPLGLTVLIVTPLIMNRRLASLLNEDDPVGTSNAPPVQELLWLLVAVAAFEVWSTIGSLVSWTYWGTNVALTLTGVASVLAFRQLRTQASDAWISAKPFEIEGFAAAAIILLLLQLPTTAEFEVLLLTDLAKIPPEVLGDRSALGNVGQIMGTALAGILLYQERSRFALLGGLLILSIGLTAYAAYPWVSSLYFIHGSRFVVGLGAGLATPVLFVHALARMPIGLNTAAGTWLVLILIGGTQIGLALFDIVLSAATAFTGSSFQAYVVVEALQASVGLLVLLVTIVVFRFPAVVPRTGLH